MYMCVAQRRELGGNLSLTDPTDPISYASIRPIVGVYTRR